MNESNACRLCKVDDQRDKYRYGKRHYAHAECGMKKFGGAFFGKLPYHELQKLSFLTVRKADLEIPLRAELDRRLRATASRMVRDYSK